MKKRKGILLTSLSLLCLASCGSGTVNTSVSETTTIEATETETAESITTTEDEKQNYLAFRKKITEMGNNIEKMPTGSEFFQCEGESVRLDSYDYTTPGSHYSEESEFFLAYQAYWNYMDELREECLIIRDLVLSEVTELDTFVKLDAVRGMLSYDELSDEIHITYTDDVRVYEITSGYTKDHKVKLTAVCYDWGSMEGDSKRQANVFQVLHYTEDSKSIYVNTSDWYSDGGIRTDMIFESDPNTHEISQTERLIENDQYYNRCYVNTAIQKQVNDVRTIIKYGSEYDQYDVEAYDQDGHLLMSYMDMDRREIIIPLYALEGWDSATSESDSDTSLTVTIGDNEYSGLKYYGDYGIHFYKNLSGYDNMPFVSLLDLTAHDLDYSKALELLNENFGLTPKTEISSEISGILSSYKEIAQSSTAFGVTTGITSFNPGLFESVYERYDYHTLDFDQVEEIINKEAISLREQELSYADLGYLNAEASGDASFDAENLTVNLGNVKLTVPASALLSDTLDYRAVLLLHGTDTKILAYGTLTHFDKQGDLVLGFDDMDISVIEDSINGESDDYVLELVVGAMVGDNFSRLSNSILLSIPQNAFKEFNSLPDEIKGYKNPDGTMMYVTTSRTLTITPQEDTVTFHIQISGVSREIAEEE